MFSKELKFRIAELYETREFLNKHHQALAKIQRERATDYIVIKLRRLTFVSGIGIFFAMDSPIQLSKKK